MIKKLTILSALLLGAASVSAQDVERVRPAEWEGLVEGGRFMDRFMPMRGEVLSSEGWGCEAVKPRFVDNGIEDDRFSYWGGNIIECDGEYHLFACGWFENSYRGHQTWSKSIIFHSTSPKMEGPYVIMDAVGGGHNPEIYQCNDGTYIIGTSIDWKPFLYSAKDLKGPWKLQEMTLEDRGRGILDNDSNLTFTQREDGSMLMVCRGGGVWISRDGKSPYRQVTTESVYPKREGRFEDPVVWRDDVQYHLIVNDWLGRVAYYLRSKDGFKWVEDRGEAYTPDIAFHEDGTAEGWYKFERIKVFQDEHGRAVQANFAVCDTLKNEDLSNDRHSSKNITIPLNKGMLLSLEKPQEWKPRMKSVTLRVKGEEGFNPAADLDIESLRFGCSIDVDYGRGCEVEKCESDGEDLLITFKSRGYTIPTEEFAPKLLGRVRSGGVAYGYLRNPTSDFNPAVLSTLRPEQSGDDVVVEIENFGRSASPATEVTLYAEGERLAKATLAPLRPYDRGRAIFEGVTLSKGVSYHFEIESKSHIVCFDECYVW